MKNIKLLFGLSLFILFNLGCSNKNNATLESGTKEPVAANNEQAQEAKIERKLIKEGRVEFETDDLNTTRKTIFDAVKKYKAYVASDEEYKSPGRKSNSLIIRVPANNFDNFLADATKGVDRFDSKEISVKDVTKEFIDIQARIKTKKELEQRYIDLLKQTKSVTEILEIEKQMGQLRSEIESIEGRLKYLQSKISLSTLNITFYQSIPNETKFGKTFKNGFKNGWDNLIWFFVFLVNIWPFIIIGIGLIFGIKKWRKRKMKQ